VKTGSFHPDEFSGEKLFCRENKEKPVKVLVRKAVRKVYGNVGK
jgi:hypothetical protein